MNICKLIVLMFIVSIGLIACKDKKIIETEYIVKEWIGKTIRIPNIKFTYVSIKDSLKYISKTNINKYKILLYTDSTGCTECKLQLHIWKTYIDDFHSKVDFLFYFQPKNEKMLLSMLKYKQIDYPIYIDNIGELNKLNNFPTNPMFQCFLLDKNNIVVAIGNPVNNQSVWELYKKIIMGQISTELNIKYKIKKMS